MNVYFQTQALFPPSQLQSLLLYIVAMVASIQVFCHYTPSYLNAAAIVLVSYRERNAAHSSLPVGVPYALHMQLPAFQKILSFAAHPGKDMIDKGDAL